MKGMKGKFLKKLKSVKPIGYLKQDRILHVNASDGFLDSCPKSSNIKPLQQQQQPHFKENTVTFQEPDIIDVSELMKDLEEEEEEQEMEFDDVDDDINDKENIRPTLKTKEEENLRRREPCKQVVPLGEIDISSFRKPDLNSCTLFDPNLLAAFEQAVKEHMKMSEAEKRARIEKNMNLEKAKQEDEPPCKARRVEQEEEEDINPLLAFEEKCPPGGDGSVVLYTTTLRGIRKTFEDCNSIKFLLSSFRVLYYERDVSMHMEYKEELWRVLGIKALPPKLFIKGRYIGGAEEVLMLHEQGKLRVLFEGIPIDRSNGQCEGCAGVRFVLCFNCNGSHRVVGDDGMSSKCQKCNENGILICPICC